MSEHNAELVTKVFEDFVNRLERDDTLEAQAKARLKELFQGRRKISSEDIYTAMFAEDEIQ